MRSMITSREWLHRRRSSLRVALGLAALLIALIWAHSSGERHPMPGEQMDDMVAVAMCLGVLNIGAAFAGVSALATRRRRQVLPVTRKQRFSIYQSLAKRVIRISPARAGPQQLQVFLS